MVCGRSILAHVSGMPQARIDESGFGPFQLLMLLLTGGIMFAEGAEMLVMGSITTLLHDHWELNAIVRGTMVRPTNEFCGARGIIPKVMSANRGNYGFVRDNAWFFSAESSSF